MPKLKPLSSIELCNRIKPIDVKFEKEKYATGPIFIGRERAKEALNFGLEIDAGHYHMFVLGPPGTGKKSIINRMLKNRSPKERTPSDWCYVYNFEDESRPIAIELPTGQGLVFRKAMDNFVAEAKQRINRAFESEEYSRRKQAIEETGVDQKQNEIKKLEGKAIKYNYQVTETPFGLAFVPILKNQPISEVQLKQLSQAAQDKYKEDLKSLQLEASSLVPRLRKIERELNELQEELNKEILRLTICPLIGELKIKFSSLPKVITFLDSLQKDIINNANGLKNEFQEPGGENALTKLLSGSRPSSHFERYGVNLFISNDKKGSPVITEKLPTVPRLTGRYDFKPRFGSFTTDFTLLKPGVLHRANGGYLVMDAIDLLTQPFSWEVLKNTLETRCISVEDVTERLPYTLPTPTLRPEPIPLTAKIILIGEPEIYYTLASLDKDFLGLFKVKVDFETDAKLDKNSLQSFSAFAYYFAKDELNSEITPEAIARLAEESQRLAEHKDKLSLNYRVLCDLITEAKHWANDANVITQQNIDQAINHKRYRSNQIEEKIREMIEENTIFISTEGTAVGQVNGVAVLSLGDYQFGKPSKITARPHIGKEGIINIERKTELSGPIHGKAVLILANYLAGKFAQKIPLALSASLTFEQEYGMIEGDSATLSELCALLSSLSGMPARQDLVITGSVNQYGDVQPVGGVNDKLEGFFMVCKAKGLTGKQGAIIPKANVKHLILKDEVVETANEGLFNIYAVETVDEAMELLTGQEANAINNAIENKLISYADQWQKYDSKGDLGTF